MNQLVKKTTTTSTVEKNAEGKITKETTVTVIEEFLYAYPTTLPWKTTITDVLPTAPWQKDIFVYNGSQYLPGADYVEVAVKTK